MTDPTSFAGIDVAKARLDIAIRPSGECWSVANDGAGISQVVARLQELQPELVILEATGGLQMPIAAALAAAGLPVVVVNPRQVRDFAKAIGKLAKTDAIDAKVLAHFGEAVRPVPRAVPDALAQELSSLLSRRRQVIEMITARRVESSTESNRLHTATKPLQARIKAHIDWLEQELGPPEAETTWGAPCARVPFGARRRPSCAPLLAWGRCFRLRCWPSCPS